MSSDEGSSPHNQVTFESQFNLPRKFEFDQTYRYVSALGAQAVNSYGTADARFSWFSSRQMEFSLVGQNLLQPRHPEFGGDPEGLVGIKRNAYAQITWKQAEN